MSQFYSVRVYNLKPETSRVEFENLSAQVWIPTVMKKKGCKGLMLLKGYVGEWTTQKFDYAAIEIWESVRAHREAWGGPRKEGAPPPDLRPFMDRLQSYVEPESLRTLEFERQL